MKEITPEQALAELERIKQKRHEYWKRWYEKHGKEYAQKRKEREAKKPNI